MKEIRKNWVIIGLTLGLPLCVIISLYFYVLFNLTFGLISGGISILSSGYFGYVIGGIFDN